MIPQTFIAGLKRLLNSSHVQASVTGLSAAFATAYFAAPGLPPAGRAALWITFMGTVGVVLREAINSITEENIAAIAASAPAADPAVTAQVQTNAGNIAKLAGAVNDVRQQLPDAQHVRADAYRATNVPPRTNLPGMK